MASQASQTSPTKISNFRDVSEEINKPSPTTSILKPSLFYRSALPATATPAAQAALTTTHHIRTIIDLRTDTEIDDQRKKEKEKDNPKSNSQSKQHEHEPSLQTSAPPPPPPQPSLQPTTKHISLNGSAYSRALLKRLTYGQTAKLAFLYAANYRPQAIAVLGTNVMAKRGLSGLAIDTLSHSTSEIRELFTTLANPEIYPVLVHCTQGKDRTGLVALLVSLLCGASDASAASPVGSQSNASSETVQDQLLTGLERDYMRSATELEAEREERVVEIGRIGLPASFAGCEEGWVGVVCGWLESEWGGVEGYLVRGCGVAIGTLDGVRKILGAR